MWELGLPEDAAENVRKAVEEIRSLFSIDRELLKRITDHFAKELERGMALICYCGMFILLTTFDS